MKRISYEENKNFIFRYTEDDVPRKPTDGMHYDSSMVITYIIEGRGSIFVENSYTDISEGDVVIVSPNEFHRTALWGDPIHKRISIYVRRELAETTGIASNRLFSIFFDRKLGKGNVIPAKVADNMGLCELFASMEAPAEGDVDADIILQCKIVELLILLKKALSLAEKEPLPSNESKTTAGVIEYINEHLTEELSTSKIADALFMDKSYLCREFKKNTGATISQYITKKRICKAVGLMAEGESCTDACYRSGFGNYSSFYKYYRRYTDSVPGERKIKKTEQKNKVSKA
jgi:AraC-like DNA-binding protein